MQTQHPDLAEVLAHESTDKRIDILRRIGEGGSISEAARRAGVSYKAAWQAIETLGNLAGTPMVEKAVGGSGGGGAVLTPAGRRVLDAAAMLDKARADVLALLDPSAHHTHASPGVAAMALRTSMRNQFPCLVKTLSSTGSITRLGLEIAGGVLLHSKITRESAQLLQLRPGLGVLALCKATAVRVAPQIDPTESLNLLSGTISRASRSVHGGEVTLQLQGSVSLVGLPEQGHHFKAGQPAVASVEESGVVVARPG
ncbi:MAG: TOBE domain-containing protein [Betaproteobacteria bacterium]|jgi:molybdate transport system regulatory protein